MRRLSACSSRHLSKLLGVAAVAGCILVTACKQPPSSRSAKDVRIVREEPRCEKIGLVEGVGGSERNARENALELAASRGATHARLDSAHPDLEDGMTFVVTAKLYRCLSSEEQFPPDGYR